MVFPTQNINRADQSSTTATSALQSQTATKTFWATKASELGVFPDNLDPNAIDGAVVANGATFTVCDPGAGAADGVKCNGGVGYTKDKTSNGNQKSYLIPNRIVMQAATTGPTGIAVGGGNAPAVFFNDDLLLASMYHSAEDAGTAVADYDTNGSKWCSPFVVELGEKDPATLQASNGLNGGSKCTWQIKAPNGEYGIGFQLKGADDKGNKISYANFHLQYVEFLNLAGLGSNAILPAGENDAFLLGSYDST